MINSNVITPFMEEDLIPKEEKLEVIKKGHPLSIGIPREVYKGENRVPLTPDAVQVLTGIGYIVMIERGTGEGAFFSDLEYSDSGAIIVDKVKAFEQDLILKITPPNEQEIGLLKPNSYLVSLLQMNLRDKNYFDRLSQKKINAIAFEFIEDENKEQVLVELIGEIAGGASILLASELLAKSKGLMLGGISGVRPTDVVVIGAGVMGEYATRAAIGLGAEVKIFDNSISRLREIQKSIGRSLATSTIDPKELTKMLRRADVVIGTLPRINQLPVVTEEMIMLMKKGSVVMDLVLDFGKCIDTVEITDMENAYVEKHGVLHCGLLNITSKVSRTTSKAISNFFLSYLLDIKQEGGFECMLSKRQEVREGFYIYKGRHTKQMICDRFGLKFNDINLLLF